MKKYSIVRTVSSDQEHTWRLATCDLGQKNVPIPGGSQEVVTYYNRECPEK